MDSNVARAERCLLDTLAELRGGYRSHTFWTERDVVYWVQLHLRDAVAPGFTVFNDYGLLPGPRRSLSADLVVVHGGRALVAAEFKYEPAKTRTDIQAKKLPVIGWVDVAKDIARLEAFVEAGAVAVAWSICVDEGDRYRLQPRHHASQTERWDTGHGTAVTLTRYPTDQRGG